jgi:NTP pyrophosphatase (non-canonical NTP hydrolase)
MELATLVERQISADRRRGFAVDFESNAERHDQLTRDLVGLIGEIGEFANILKKVGLGLTHPGYVGPTLDGVSPSLREELADAIIYIFRLSTILGADLEADVLAKMKVNDDRYGPLEG